MTKTLFTEVDEVLIGMGQIVAREQAMAIGSYLMPNKRVQDPLCGGVNVCAIGSLYVAAGIEPEVSAYDGSIIGLPGASEHLREEFMKDKPVLAKAYSLLNLSARNFADDNGLDLTADNFDSELENLFETGWTATDEDVDADFNNFPFAFNRDDLLTVVAGARTLLREELV